MNLGCETEQIEFKKTTSELKEGAESVAAILNKHGRGELYFGVRKDGEVTGQDVSESTLRQISHTIGNSIDPRIYPIVEALDDGEGHSYVRVTFEGTETPYACKGVYRVRVADEDTIMTTSQIAAMIKKSYNESYPWDRRPSQRPIADVDEGVLRNYVARGQECGRIPFSFTDTEDVLNRLGLLVDGNLTNAADVLFCPSNEIRLKMGILATHRRTEILDLQQESGTVFDLVHKAELYIRRNLRSRFVMNATGPRDEIPELPPQAVKEALMNAYAHCDWTLGGCLQIDIFNDRVDILSLGWFIEGQDPEEHLSGKSMSTRTRNKLIVETLFRSGDIESYGTGIPRIKELCEKEGVRIEYVKSPDGTRLLFHRNDAFFDASPNEKENSPQSAEKLPNSDEACRKVAEKLPNSDEACRKVAEKLPNYPDSTDERLAEIIDDWTLFPEVDRMICRYLIEHGKSRNSTISEDLGLSARTSRNILKRLTELGVVTVKGTTKARTYALNYDSESKE